MIKFSTNQLINYTIMNINNVVALQTLTTSYCCPNSIILSSREHLLVLLFFCISSLIAELLSCPLLLLEVFRFFFPLLLSTGICFTVVYQFILSENHQGITEAGLTNFEDVIDDNDCQDIIIGEEEAPQHYNRLRFCTEIGLVEITHAPVESSASCSEDGNYSVITVKVVLMEEKGRKTRKESSDDNQDQEQEHTASWVDGFAEGVWNCY